MTHYRVLVIGDNIKEQLSPYDENINVAPYKDYYSPDTMKVFRGIADEKKISVMEYLLLTYPEEKPGLDDKGYFFCTNQNPKAKWD